MKIKKRNRAALSLGSLDDAGLMSLETTRKKLRSLRVKPGFGSKTSVPDPKSGLDSDASRGPLRSPNASPTAENEPSTSHGGVRSIETPNSPHTTHNFEPNTPHSRGRSIDSPVVTIVDRAAPSPVAAPVSAPRSVHSMHPGD